MKIRTLAVTLVTASMLMGCAPKNYVVVNAPKKTDAEKKQAIAMAEHIFPITNGKSLAKLQTELAKPEIQEKLHDTVDTKFADNSLGECLNRYGFSDYFINRLLAEETPAKLKDETIRLWVEQIPMDMFSKADQNFSDPHFSRTYKRLTEMEGSDTRAKLNTLVSQKEITESQANDFFLTIEDRDMKSFLILTYNDGRIAIKNLVAKDKSNPAGVIRDFMKTHPNANANCSIVKGGEL